MLPIVVSVIAAITALTGTYVARKNHRDVVRRLDEDRVERREHEQKRSDQAEIDRQCLAIENAVKRAADSDPHTQQMGFLELNALMESGQVPESRMLLVESVTRVMLKTFLERATHSPTPIEVELIRPTVITQHPELPAGAALSRVTDGEPDDGSTATPVARRDKEADSIGESAV